MSFFEGLLIPSLPTLLRSFDVDVKEGGKIVEHELQLPLHHHLAYL